MKILNSTEILLNRFWSKVNKRGKDECWMWIAYRYKDGYGRFRLRSITQYAHRVAWELTNGPIPKGKCILHKCDNKGCVNPNHLYLGTYSDNVYDRYKRNPESYPGNPKLSIKEVQRIRELYSTCLYSLEYLACMFNCGSTTIRTVLKKEGTYQMK